MGTSGGPAPGVVPSRRHGSGGTCGNAASPWSSGPGPRWSSSRPSSGRSAPRPDDPHAVSTTTRRWPRTCSTSSGSTAPISSSTSVAASSGAQIAGATALLDEAFADDATGSWSSCRATPTRRSPVRSRRMPAGFRSSTSRQDCGATTGRCRRSTTASSPTISPTSAAPRPRRVERSSRPKASRARASIVTGNTVVDAATRMLPDATQRTKLLERHGLDRDGYVLSTFHRPENVDDERVLARHPRRAGRPPAPRPAPPPSAQRGRAARDAGLLELPGAVRIVEPLGYRGVPRARARVRVPRLGLRRRPGRGQHREASGARRPRVDRAPRGARDLRRPSSRRVRRSASAPGSGRARSMPCTQRLADHAHSVR